VLAEVDEVVADGRGCGFLVVGMVDADAGEDIQGVLPVLAGPLDFLAGMVGVGEPVVGAGLVVRLT
jgi:hypothetical protein